MSRSWPVTAAARPPATLLRIGWLRLLVALAWLAPGAHAEPVSVAAGAGVVRTEDTGSAVWLTGSVRFRLWNVRLEPEIGFWTKSDRAYGLEASVRDLQLGVNLVLRRPIGGGRLELVAAAGASAHRVRNKGGPIGQDQPATTDTRPGVQIQGGLEVWVSPRAALFLTGRADLIFEPGDSSNQWQKKLYGGLRVSR